MAVFVKLLMWIGHLTLRMLDLITRPLFCLIYDRKKHPLPAISNPLLKESAMSLATKIREKKVTSEDVVRAFIDRIHAVNKSINAVVADRFQAALEEAKQVDKILQQDPLPAQYSIEKTPLLGIPFTAKEAFAITGMPNTSGLLRRRGVIANKDADAVTMMRQAGAIPIALTNCSELCMWYESNNLVYGRSNNAYHQGRMVGGSSGGEGCVLSAAGSVIGIGSDIGGSIRLPAFFNGVFGHKPTTGIVSNLGQFPAPDKNCEAYTFLSTGPMCRYATDLLPMLRVLAGTEGTSRLKLDDKVDLKKLKVYYQEDNCDGLMTSPVQEQIRSVLRQVVAHMHEQVGCEAEQVYLKRFRHSLAMWASRMNGGNSHSFVELMGNLEAPVKPLRELLLWLTVIWRNHTIPSIGLALVEGVKNSPEVDANLAANLQRLKQEISSMLGEKAVLLFPTQPRPAPYHNQPLITIPDFSYAAIFNVLGFPVTQVPLGLGKEGVPLGLQVVANFHCDHLSLAVACELESAFGGWVMP